MPLNELENIVRIAVQRFERSGGREVGRDAQNLLINHAAAEIDEIDHRLESRDLSSDALVNGIVELLEAAQRGEGRPPIAPPPGYSGDRLYSYVEFGPIDADDVALAMSKNCPVFPYCPDAHLCPH